MSHLPKCSCSLMKLAPTPPQMRQPEMGREGDQIDAHRGISDMHLPLRQRQGDAGQRGKCFLFLTFLAWITVQAEQRSPAIMASVALS